MAEYYYSIIFFITPNIVIKSVIICRRLDKRQRIRFLEGISIELQKRMKCLLIP